MELTSITFLVFCFAVVILANLSANPRFRAAVMAIASILFITSYISSPIQLFGLAAILILGYLCVAAARSRSINHIIAISVTALVGLFVYLKHYAFVSPLPQLPFIYLTLGLSYILFRVIHLIVDTAEGEIPQPVGLLDYFNYTCNFLTFTSGPIQRYQGYLADKAAARTVDESDAYEGFRRIAIGYFKMLAISAVAKVVFDKLADGLFGPAHMSWPVYCAHYAAVCCSYTIFLYYNFSGFIDVVIGFGRLIGLRFPENFNHPFEAGNFLDFWGRWHMTLSHWFRDYMFNPLLRFLMGRFESPSLATTFGVICFFVTFLVMGIWHGATSVFVIYGFVMGAGASINKIYQLWMEARLGRKRYRALRSEKPYTYMCRGMTFAFYSMAVTGLWIDIGQLVQVARHVNVLGVVGVYAALTVIGTVALFAADIIRTALSGIAREQAWAGWAPVIRNAKLACIILAALAVDTMFSGPPEFVYRAF